MSDPFVADTFPALGTTAVVCVADPTAADAAVTIVRAAVDAIDRAASRFRADSELLALHEHPGRPVVVSPLLFSAIEDALLAARYTGGAVDPTVGQAMEILGYDRDFASVPRTGPDVRATVQRVPGWRGVRMNRSTGAVTLPVGVQLDLGATAKAGCADRAASAASAACGSGVLVSLGGDVAVAGAPPPDGWAIRVADRHDAPPDAPSVTVAVRQGGLATSGTTARRWSRGGRELHHLLDPTTGQPADSPWRTVTVAADSCLRANTASTAAIIMGADAPDWLDRHGLCARLVALDGSVLGVGGWPWDALACTDDRLGVVS